MFLIVSYLGFLKVNKVQIYHIFYHSIDQAPAKWKIRNRCIRQVRQVAYFICLYATISIIFLTL